MGVFFSVYLASIISEAIDRFSSYSDQCEDTANEDIQIEQKEVLLVMQSYTVIDPYAMMIHSDDTSFTYTAMMCSWRFQAFTLMTEISKRLF